MSPNFRFEKTAWKRGFRHVAGIDEVGRGALAGPVVAGCVVYKKHIKQGQSLQGVKINDSKKLTPKQRVIADAWIRENSLTWGIGESSTREIDKLGIVKATNRAMRRAIGNANQRLRDHIEYLLIDAYYLPYTKGIRMPCKHNRNTMRVHGKQFTTHSLSPNCGCQTAIIKGDEKSFSIASASIIAKVYRDNLMIKLGSRRNYKKYGWGRNKGYGTREHANTLKKTGISCQHRKSFMVKSWGQTV